MKENAGKQEMMPFGAKNLICHNPHLPLPISVDITEAEVENHAVLSYAVEKEHTYVSPAVKPDNKVSNVLVGTTLLELLGSILSFVQFTEVAKYQSVFSEICS